MPNSLNPLLQTHFDTALEHPNGIKKLRELILTLAMQGKLVPQDPNDQPASELLKEIQAEKARLVAEGKVKKSEALPAVKEEEKPFLIPKGWEWVRLGEIGFWRSGSTPSRSNSSYFDGNIPWVKSGEVKQRFINDTEEKISENAFRKFSLPLIPKDSILIAMYGANIGEVGVLNIDATTNQAICACTPFKPKESRFLLNFIESRREYYLGMSAGAAQPNISREKIINTPLPLPPLAEQKRIVEKIDELFLLCDELERLKQSKESKRKDLHQSVITQMLEADTQESFQKHFQFLITHFHELYSVKENVKELRKAVLQLAVMGKLVPQDPNDQPASELLKEIQAEKARLVQEGKVKKSEVLPPVKEEEKPFAIPKGWEWVRFFEITINRDGERRPVSKDDRQNLQGIFDYYGASGIIDKINNFIFDKDLLLIGEDGANLISRSTPIAFIARGKYWVNNHAHVIDFTHDQLMYYMEKYINAINLKPYVTGTAQPKMNQAKMNGIPIPLPPLAEQKRIVEKVDELLVLCDELEEKIGKAEEKRGEILDGMVRV
ncbi:restriction endonuclease subunit S [Leptospira sp. 85282-16]|nr:restriction endonuclease subunit S [Leptospira sp. 85282-16]